jgi:hypothetical protein
MHPISSLRGIKWQQTGNPKLFGAMVSIIQVELLSRAAATNALKYPMVTSLVLTAYVGAWRLYNWLTGIDESEEI